MNDAKYIGLDVHQATISASVLDSIGKLVMESVLETKAATILQFIHGLRGSLHVTFEEGRPYSVHRIPMSGITLIYVAVVDDDESVCRSFGRLLRAAALRWT